jgi:hypothetical protein
LQCDSFHIYLTTKEREQVGILRGPSRSIGIIIAALAPPRAARMPIGFQNCTPNSDQNRRQFQLPDVLIEEPSVYGQHVNSFRANAHFRDVSRPLSSTPGFSDDSQSIELATQSGDGRRATHDAFH